MCRLLGIMTLEPSDFGIVLREGPRSLAYLSQEHPDGWGVAVFDGAHGWDIQKGTESAHRDDRFHARTAACHGTLLLSHVRAKTVGATSLENTHPFERDGWVFAHNGTITDLDYLRSRVSARRAAEVLGDTDSELFFAWFLSELDRNTHHATTDAVVKSISEEARARPGFGAFNFFLSDGRVTYAHRFGRTLHVLYRGPQDEVRRERTDSEGMTVYTPWAAGQPALFIASEPLSDDEPWQEVAEGTLLRVARAPAPVVHRL